MFRCLRILGNNIITRPPQQQSYFLIRWTSTVAQENEIEIKVDDAYKKKKEEFENAFANISDVSSLLKSATSTHKIESAFKALDILADWCSTKNLQFDEIERDKNYKNLVKVLEKQCYVRPVDEIVMALKNLKKMGVPSNHYLVESMENDLLWHIRKVTIQNLFTILAFQLQYQDTERQKKVIEQAIISIEKRWTEVKYARDFCYINSLANSFSPTFHNHIDDLIMEMAENMKIADLAKIFVAISHSKRRPTPVLRTLAYHMFKKNDQLPPQQISNVLYAMNALSFPNETLLGKLSSDILAQIEQVDQSTIIGAIALCMGQMRWKEKDLLDALVKWVIKNIDNCRSNDVVSLIITLATVYHLPDNIEELLNICTSKLDFSLISEKNILVDIVWALLILGRATHEQISTVLHPDFIAEFPVGDPSCVGSHLKLMNINSAAEVLEESYNGPKLQFTDVNNLLITHSRKDLALISYVHKILHNFLPPPKYLRENIRTKYGFIIDAELLVDKTCKPLDLSEFSFDIQNGKGTKSIPPEAHKVALMVWNYKDYTIGSSSLTGQNTLAIRILNKLGYKAIQIPYYDINYKEKTLKNVQYFERKIREAVTM